MSTRKVLHMQNASQQNGTSTAHRIAKVIQRKHKWNENIQLKSTQNSAHTHTHTVELDSKPSKRSRNATTKYRQTWRHVITFCTIKRREWRNEKSNIAAVWVHVSWLWAWNSDMTRSAFMCNDQHWSGQPNSTICKAPEMLSTHECGVMLVQCYSVTELKCPEYVCECVRMCTTEILSVVSSAYRKSNKHNCDANTHSRDRATHNIDIE